MVNNISLNVLKEALDIEDYVISTRRYLHENPEIGLQETNTIQHVTNELTKMSIPFEIIDNGGIIGYIQGKKPGKKLILRADLDALPMKESEFNLKQKKEVVSKNDAAAHTCGHDAHTAMLLGAAKILTAHKDLINGTIILAFEQGEEMGGGIYNLLTRLKEIGADGIWGIHLKSDMPAGKISVEAGPRMASAFSFKVMIEGKSGHGSRPDLSIAPLDCFTDFYQNIKSLRLTGLNPFDPIALSIGTIEYGNAANIIPQTLTFSGTCRFLHYSQGKQAEIKFKELLSKICDLHNCQFKYLSEPKAMDLIVYNNEQCSQIATESVSNALGSEVNFKYPAWMASESFSMYQKYFPGVFAFLGIANEELGSGAEHHNEKFDVDESALKIGVASTVQYAIDFLNVHEDIKFTPDKRTVKELFIDNGFQI
ncbi:amidohydrolase [Ureibacillus acetophenoni]|uniref:Amidohydrolase n=1 Tax=Ureibacillus acetophenoni TaxID=614649 RepID=A0A285UD57_9BACL|nr:amidohydrolase [Ureibacillus acetophenoni]SOC38526.1 amidohydrolase [Ureibacillus acetophenoni]